jgi:putative hydrolase of HD superfamily
MQEITGFLYEIGLLKRFKRTGWFTAGVPAPESVADHSFRVALLALVLSRGADPPLDRERCVAMALVHDLAESIVGDITPYDGVTTAEKHRRERGAMERLSAMLGDDEVLRLWEEYQAAETAEARLVKDLDKLETVLQAAEYGESRGAELAEFREMGERRTWLPAARPIYEALRGKKPGDSSPG